MIDLEQRIQELERDKKDLLNQLEAERERNYSMRRQQEADFEKLYTLTAI